MSVKDIIATIDQLSKDPSIKVSVKDITTPLSTASSSDCRQVVSKIKDKIKGKRVTPQGKLQVLKVLGFCMKVKNSYFCGWVGKKMLGRLAKLAAHRKVSQM